ncbi:MAG TPA: endo-1,4-beta-xylanase [Chryseolinea sp.]|nr:endo-1,4-beta-xylanase [Chryseolinea sp.]HPH46352.1 endo-1,4-beta-xylanase [Chryseolinea sp.]HPM30179.1 endo-1,4-beta-xylanase [Chryseolinea sp.]
MRNYIFTLLVTSVFVTSCSSDDENVIPVIPPVAVVIESLHKEVPFPIGASVGVNLMKNNTKYNGVVTIEYNSITAENAMKFGALHPSENTFIWTDADYLVSYAQASNKRIHGHTLNWYTSLPTWLTNFQGDSAAWENILKNHIQTVVTHFKGKVASWDVVNEAFNDNGTLRNSIWVQKLGTDYIARCFQYAHEADPNALLFYNDYGHEYSSAKRIAITNMISSFLTRGIPIHGIGMQFHMTYTQTDANISAAINSAAATGLKVHISELDIRLNNDKVPGLVFTPLLASQQADKYKFVVKTFNAIPSAQKYGITTWNVGDADSWIPGWLGAPDYPLPFDKDYLRKPAYYGIVDGVK